jgi:hypothetical protein
MTVMGRGPAQAAARQPYIIFGILLAALIILRHLPNLRRLVAGTETKIGEKAEAPRAQDAEGGPESETEYR